MKTARFMRGKCLYWYSAAGSEEKKCPSPGFHYQGSTDFEKVLQSFLESRVTAVVMPLMGELS